MYYVCYVVAAFCSFKASYGVTLVRKRFGMILVRYKSFSRFNLCDNFQGVVIDRFEVQVFCNHNISTV